MKIMRKKKWDTKLNGLILEEAKQTDKK
jgi:hypothetical protein